MTWDEVKELGPDYALGVLDENTRRDIEEFLRHAEPEQLREFKQWEKVVGMLALTAPEATTPSGVKELLMKSIGDNQEVETSPDIIPIRRNGSSFYTKKWLPIAATLLLTLTCGLLLLQNYRLINERDGLVNELNEVQKNFDRLVSPFTKVIAMVGEEAPQASAKVVWDTEKKEWVIYIYNLPPPPADKDYQLWYVTNDAKVSASVFRDEKVLKLSLPPSVINNLAATAVTLEPRGGSPQPTGKFYLKGAISL